MKLRFNSVINVYLAPVSTVVAEQVAIWDNKNVIQTYNFPIAWSSTYFQHDWFEYSCKEEMLRVEKAKTLKLLQAWVSRFTIRLKKNDTPALIQPDSLSTYK